jgi:two-component system sensor histidine kinase/response regulator
LINDILDLSKVESGRLSLEETAFNLERIAMRSARRSPSALTPKASNWMRVGPDVSCNLVGGNAIKFPERGKVVVQVEREPGASRRRWLRFAVMIPESEFPRTTRNPVLELHAGRSFDRAAFRGRGLGLSIVRRLVELMGGRT